MEDIKKSTSDVPQPTQQEYEITRADLLTQIKLLHERLDGLDAAWAERNGQERLFQRECLAEARRTLH